MNKTFFLLLWLVAIFTSCDKAPVDPNPSTIIILGQVDDISLATNNANSFALLLSTPNNEIYEALLFDTTQIADFEVGKSVALKGKIPNNTIHVDKIISTDNNNFVLKGEIIAITENSGGYNAEISGIDEENYFAEISISNLGDDYQTFYVGETHEVKGNLWKSDSKLQITVQEIVK